MSIATLKRKTLAKYNNVSVSQQQFSINGGYRNQGYIGQTSLSRSLPRTLYRGDTARGSGGCCGTYNITPMVQSAVTSTENHNIIKQSVLGNNGSIVTHYRWIRRPRPFTSVKPDNTHNLNTAQDQTDIIKKQTLAEIANCKGKNFPSTNVNCSTPTNDTISTCSLLRRNYPYTINNVQNPIVKPESSFVAMSQGEYIFQLDKNCGALDTAFQEQQNNTDFGGTPIGC